MGDLPDLPQGKGCILPAIFLIFCAAILIGGLMALGYALSELPAFK